MIIVVIGVVGTEVQSVGSTTVMNSDDNCYNARTTRWMGRVGGREEGEGKGEGTHMQMQSECGIIKR